MSLLKPLNNIKLKLHHRIVYSDFIEQKQSSPHDETITLKCYRPCLLGLSFGGECFELEGFIEQKVPQCPD